MPTLIEIVTGRPGASQVRIGALAPRCGGVAVLFLSAITGCGSSGSVGPASDPDAGTHSHDASADRARVSNDANTGSDGTRIADAGSGPDGQSSTIPDGTTIVSPAPLNLGAAGSYVILAETGISTVSPSTITGDLGVSPAAATYITGFSLIADPTNVFSTSSQVTGKVYAADYASPTPTNLTAAVADMGTAFTAAAGRAPDVTGWVPEASAG